MHPSKICLFAIMGMAVGADARLKKSKSTTSTLAINQRWAAAQTTNAPQTVTVTGPTVTVTVTANNQGAVAAVMNQQQGSNIVNVMGTVTIPALAAMAPIITLTTTAGAAGATVNAQVYLAAAGRGPGVCAAIGSSSSTFTDNTGRVYSFLCGANFSGGNLNVAIMTDWSACVNSCVSIANCGAVVWTKSTQSCQYKNLKSISNPSLVLNTGDDDNQVAFLPAALQQPWASTVISSAGAGGSFNTALVSYSTIPATGVVTVPSITSPGTIVDATAHVSQGSTVSVAMKIRWR